MAPTISPATNAANSELLLRPATHLIQVLRAITSPPSCTSRCLEAGPLTSILASVETLPGHLNRMPEGGDRFQAELLSHGQRDRILAAMAEVIAKRGYQGTTVEHIVKRAGVARATFYENFENREDCLLAGFAAAAAEARRRILAATATEEDWPEKVRVGIAAYLDYVVSDPALARTCIVEAMTAGSAAMDRYEQALQSFVPLFRHGRRFAPPNRQLPETLEDSIVGGIIWMIHQRLSER